MNTDNPYSAPKNRLSEPASAGESQSLRTIARKTFLAWERLRLIFIAILAVEILAFGTQAYPRMFELGFWLAVFPGFAAANVCFLFGPIIETCINWLGLPTRVLRPILFVTGTAYACLLAANTLALITTPHSS